MRVVATGKGFDGICIREAGEEFDMPDHVFDKRPKKDEKGKPIEGVFYDPPSWFKKVEPRKGPPPAKEDPKDLA